MQSLTPRLLTETNISESNLRSLYICRPKCGSMQPPLSPLLPRQHFKQLTRRGGTGSVDTLPSWNKNPIVSSIGAVVQNRVTVKNHSLNYKANLASFSKQANTSSLGVHTHQGVSSVQGLLKHENQDRAVAISNLLHASKGPKISYSAVFDGHDGHHTAEYAADRLHQDTELCLSLNHLVSNGGPFLIEECPEILPGVLCQLIHAFMGAFHRLDHELLKFSRDSGQVDGATALAGFHVGCSLLIANAGDSRAVLARDGKALRLTQDHKPNVPSERSRIESVGGHVEHHKGSWRIVLPGRNKICSTSRAFGDLHFKDHHLITAEPDITNVTLLPNIDMFSIFATDGVWDHVGDQEAVDEVSRVLTKYTGMSSLISLQQVALAASRKLVKLSLDSGSVDDISAVVNVFEWVPNWE